MSNRGLPWIEVPELVSERIGDVPLARARVRLERAIEAALDAEGWPKGDRGGVAVPASYWFVNIRDKYKSVKGYVGPIPDFAQARRVRDSWQGAQYRAAVERLPVGPALTNSI